MTKKPKKVKIPFWERAMWWLAMLGSLIIVAVAVPALPWRYSRVDTNCGNRFVMERYYFLTGVTNNLGKTQGWMSLRRKVQRKTEEFGRPSPLVAIAGVASQSLGAGGAAMGCPMWMVCKEHVNGRFMQYTTVAYSSFACIAGAVLVPAFSAGAMIYLGFKQQAEAKGKKKKKKKKDDECMDIEGKIAAFAVLAFMSAFGVVAGFVIITLKMFKFFAETAYYPFAMAHGAPFAGGLGCMLLFITAFISTKRVWGKKDPEEAGEYGGEWGGGGGEWGGKG